MCSGPERIGMSLRVGVAHPSASLRPAFELLANTVSDFYLRGRPCLGATLKPKLYERGFNEKAFDFNKFGEFIHAAESAGYVKLSKTSGGDIAISPTSSPATPVQAIQPALPFMPDPTTVSPSVLSSNIPLRVRRDLWNAFNSHSDKWVYDPDQDRACAGDARGRRQASPAREEACKSNPSFAN
jgi:hypothetical protein